VGIPFCSGFKVKSPATALFYQKRQIFYMVGYQHDISGGQVVDQKSFGLLALSFRPFSVVLQPVS